VLVKKTIQPDPNAKINLTKNTCVTLYLQVGSPTRLTTGSIGVSRVLDGPSQKSTRIEICKKISTQPGPNPWWAGLTRGFQPILIALMKSKEKRKNGMLEKKTLCKM